MPNTFKGLSMRDLPVTEAVYTFVNSDTGRPTHIAASTLLATVKRVGVIPIMAMIAPSLVQALEAGTLGVEPEHALTLPDEALDAPILVLEWGATHVIADGAHRLWRRWKRGDTEFPAYLIPERAWNPGFTIYDMPGGGAFWDTFNRHAKVRTLAMKALQAELERRYGGKP